MSNQNKITSLFGIKYPIIQAGMIWCSGWRLASSVSNSGGLGIIGSGSMYPDVLEEHVVKCKKATNNPFAVNLPMLYPDIDKHIETIIKHKVPGFYIGRQSKNMDKSFEISWHQSRSCRF